VREGAAAIGSERGSVSVLSAAILALAGVLCLLSVDVARVLHARQQAQLAADAAALAAAQELAIPTGAGPSTFAQEYAARNGAALLSCACEPGSPSALVQVQVDVALVFLPGTRSVTAEARAVVEGADRFSAPVAGRTSGRLTGGYQQRELARPSVPELVGLSELAAILGVSKQRVSELRRLDGFPHPIAQLAAGPVWARPMLQRFIDQWPCRPGRPRKVAADESRVTLWRSQVTPRMAGAPPRRTSVGPADPGRSHPPPSEVRGQGPTRLENRARPGSTGPPPGRHPVSQKGPAG
jgi:secretion/DNA translocation related TadE-like protein